MCAGAALPCAATAATSPVKPSVKGSAPPAAAPGRTLKVTTTLRSSKTKTIRVGLVLATGTRAKGGLALGAGKKVRVRAGRRVRLAVSGKIAANALRNGTRRLLVCVDPARAVRGYRAHGFLRGGQGRGRRRRVPRSGQPGRRRPRRPADHRRAGAPVPPVGRRQQQQAAEGLPRQGGRAHARRRQRPGEQLRLAPGRGARPRPCRYFLPPTATGNAWIGKPRAKARAEDPLACKGFGQLQSIADGGFNNQYQRPLGCRRQPRQPRARLVPQMDGETARERLPHAVRRPRTPPRAAPRPIKYALAFPKIWYDAHHAVRRAQVRRRRELLPRARWPLRHLRRRRLRRNLGVRSRRRDRDHAPYPALGNYPVPGKWCTDRPAFTVIYPGLDNFVARARVHARHPVRAPLQDAVTSRSRSGTRAAPTSPPTWSTRTASTSSATRSPAPAARPGSARRGRATTTTGPFWMMLQRENGSRS